jgi:hypothetical protein
MTSVLPQRVRDISATASGRMPSITYDPLLAVQETEAARCNAEITHPEWAVTLDIEGDEDANKLSKHQLLANHSDLAPTRAVLIC